MSFSTAFKLSSFSGFGLTRSLPMVGMFWKYPGIEYMFILNLLFFTLKNETITKSENQQRHSLPKRKAMPENAVWCNFHLSILFSDLSGLFCLRLLLRNLDKCLTWIDLLTDHLDYFRRRRIQLHCSGYIQIETCVLDNILR